MRKYTITFTDFVPYLGHEITSSISLDASMIYGPGGEAGLMRTMNDLANIVNEAVAKRLADAGIVLDEFGRKASDEATDTRGTE